MNEVVSWIVQKFIKHFGLLTAGALLLAGIIGVLMPHSLPSAEAQILLDRTMSEALEAAQAAYLQNNTRNAFITFDDGANMSIGDITEIGVDFICFLVMPPVFPANVTPGANARVDRCLPITRIRQVDLTYRIPR